MKQEHINLPESEQIYVGRELSYFHEDLLKFELDLVEKIQGKTILVIGGAGSIGSNTINTILQFSPKKLHIIDHNENGLAEIVRDIRSSKKISPETELLTMPMDYGSSVFEAWFLQNEKYDHILNFSALKHVRSEKDPYSVLAMIDTNVLKLQKFSDLLGGDKEPSRLFCVSTDKAANPSSLMGATKRLMEHALFSAGGIGSEKLVITSARFANVASSNGSLLQSWENRFQRNQILACPENCKRFFVSLSESGHLCALAAFCGDANSIHVPTLNPEEHLVLLQEVVAKFLKSKGKEPYFTRDEAEATSKLSELNKMGKYPVLLTPLDTAGEKPYEEFVGKNETIEQTHFNSLLRVPYVEPNDPEAFGKMVDYFKELLKNPNAASNLNIDQIKEQIGFVESDFMRTHVSSPFSLDQRI